MIVSATWFTSPVMIYNGQESGEVSDGPAGFSGADGRTTIFDYWGMPNHQKWMNDGKFDGGKLKSKQHELRKFYNKLLLLCQEPAIQNGYMYDLHPHNRSNSRGYKDYSYAFLRFTTEQQLLIIVNFSNTHSINCHLKIPQTAIEAMELPENHNYKVKDIFLSDQESSFNTSKVIVNEIEEGLLLGLEPLGCYVFEILKN